MIPSNSILLTNNVEVKSQPSKTYKMDSTQMSIGNNYVNGKDALIQTIYKILNTERYQHIMYSWNYGVEFLDLFGKPIHYVCPEIERRITEALLQDDRITSVDNFEFDTSIKRTVIVKFTVHTIFGDIESEKAVNINV